jgi:hypothetical protein
MKIPFKRFGWIYKPVSVLGWSVTIIYFAISVFTLISIDQSYNSLKNSLIRFFPYFMSFSVVFFWIASNNSTDKPGKKND